jgi:uncharacterized protein (DUF362 family)
MYEDKDDSVVTIFKVGEAEYPKFSPYNPSQFYPEYQLESIDPEVNWVYEGIRSLFYNAGLDIQNYGKSNWNPLKEYINPGEIVLLKPNLVKEIHPRDPQGWIYTLTHGSVIRAVADYVFKALNGDGKIIIADAPQTDSSFVKIISLLGLDVLADFYKIRGLNLEIVDLRQEEWINLDGIIVDRHKLQGDPNGYVAFDLGDKSEFINHFGERYYGADYDADELKRHHSNGHHEYLIAGSAIKCNVFINLPKLKTHKKAGITVNLKNLVGINGDKNWLPHYSVGYPSHGGDQFPEPSFLRKFENWSLEKIRKLALAAPRLGTLVYRQARSAGIVLFGDTEDVIRHGNWYGNDTTWRMCLDLNKIMFYGNLDGSLRDGSLSNRKRFLSIVDGIIGGQGRGPMNPDPMPAGLLLFGINPAVVDAVAAVLMGYDPECIPIVNKAFQCKHYPLIRESWRNISCLSNNPNWSKRLGEINSNMTFQFEPHFGWKGHIENRK